MWNVTEIHLVHLVGAVLVHAHMYMDRVTDGQTDETPWRRKLAFCATLQKSLKVYPNTTLTLCFCGEDGISSVMYKLNCYVLFTHTWNSCSRWLRICFKPTVNIIKIYSAELYSCRSQCSRCLRYRSAAAYLLELLVRIAPRAWISVSCGCCVLSGRGLCDLPKTHPEESYRVCVSWSVIRCNNSPAPEISG
jgi:hypothetical protein